MTLKQQRLEKQQQERVQQQEENFPNQMDATERRAAVHPGISDRIRAEERRLRDREFERLYEEDKEPATQREQTARTLRAQRPAAAKRGSSPVETPAVVTPPTNSLKARQQAAKDEKRRKAEEITKKHMKKEICLITKNIVTVPFMGKGGYRVDYTLPCEHFLQPPSQKYFFENLKAQKRMKPNLKK